MSAKLRQPGLVADMWPLIRMMQLSGHYLFEYHTEMGGFWTGMRLGYSIIQTVLIVIQFGFLFLNLAGQADDVNDLAANTITVLFFTHSITKFIYFAVLRQSFYRTLGAWNTINSHPLFSESHSRYHAVAVGKIRKLILYIVIATLLSIGAWTGITFVGESTREISDPDSENETMIVEVPRLMLRSYYPWDSMDGMGWMTSFIYQFYWLFFTLFHANLLDTMFCCWLIFTCEQLVHLKEIMKPLVELSAALDTLMPHPTELFRVPTGNQIQGSQNGNYEVNLRGLYSNQSDFNGFRNTGPLAMVDHSTTIVGPNGLSRKQEILVRSAIKYWVERHKHVVRFVGMIGDTYGGALLLHMLTSTITLTLLAYQATKIDGVDVYAASVIGYLLYTLGQVFLFCIFGNRLIEESSSVLEAAYSVEWYDGSEEAKTFIQIVCQQCQKPMSISGAKFFTVSLDLFASVLGAVVTYFMVLVQLN